MVHHRPTRGPWAFRQTFPVPSFLPLLLLLLIPCATKAQQQYQDNVVFYKKSNEGILRCVAQLQYSLSPEPSGTLKNLECQLSSDTTLSTSSGGFNCDQLSPAPWWPESWDNKIGECRQQMSFSSFISSTSSFTSTSSLSSSPNSRTSISNEPSGSTSDTPSSSTLDCICEESTSTGSGENLFSSESSDGNFETSSLQSTSTIASSPAASNPSFSSLGTPVLSSTSASSKPSGSTSDTPTSSTLDCICEESSSRCL